MAAAAVCPRCGEPIQWYNRIYGWICPCGVRNDPSEEGAIWVRNEETQKEA